MRTDFTDLLTQVADRTKQSTLSISKFSNEPLIKHLENVFSTPFGDSGSFLGDPVFEAVFGWKGSDKSLRLLRTAF